MAKRASNGVTIHVNVWRCFQEVVLGKSMKVTKDLLGSTIGLVSYVISCILKFL
jgi:hypothetical protein